MARDVYKRQDYSRPLLDDVLRDCLVRLNRNLPVMAIDEASLKLNDFDAGSLLQKNIIFMDYLQTVSYTHLDVYKRQVYDPCCGSGGMFVQSAKFVENHSGNIRLLRWL